MSTASPLHQALDQALRQGDAAEVLRLQLQREVLRICGTQSRQWVGKLVAAKAVGGDTEARTQAAAISRAILAAVAAGVPLESNPDLPADYSMEKDNLLVYQFVPLEAVHAPTPQDVRLVFVTLIDPVLAWDFGGVIHSAVAEGRVDGRTFAVAADLVDVRAA